MKLHDATKNGVAQQQQGDEIYEVAFIFDIPIERRYWSLSKRLPSEKVGSTIYQTEQLDTMAEYVEKQLGLNTDGWIKL